MYYKKAKDSKLLKFMHLFIFSAIIAYKQNKIRLADEERERKRRLEIEEALKKAEERKRLCNKTGCVHKTLDLDSISIISSIYENYQ